MAAHVRSNGRHFLMARFLVYLKYKVSKTNIELGYFRAVLLEVTAHIRSNVSHFLTAGMSDAPILGTSDTGSSQVMHPYSNCTYKVKQKPLLDGWVLGVLNI